MRVAKVRKLTIDELADLKVSDNRTLLVPDSNHWKESGVLVAARLKISLRDSDIQKMREGGKGFLPIPSAYIQTDYGVEYSVSLDHLYTEEDASPIGIDAKIVETVGSQVSMTVYAPGMDGEDVLARMHKVLRAEFGTGVLQLRQQTNCKVSETGLPTVLGVPDNAVPRLI